MLKARIIPTLLWKKFSLVKGIGFDSWRNIGHILPAIKIYNQREVDELIILDTLGHQSYDITQTYASAEYAQECIVPLTVGGGIRDASQAHNLLRLGADKVSVNTFAYENPDLINQISKRYGEQCVVASIDVRREDNDWRCYSRAGKYPTGRSVVAWAKELESRGAGEILLTSIERDGTMQGYDLALISQVCSAVKIPVIASGGAGNYQHLIDAINQAGASAVAAASMFHFTEQTPLIAKREMKKAGINVRLSV